MNKHMKMFEVFNICSRSVVFNRWFAGSFSVVKQNDNIVKTVLWPNQNVQSSTVITVMALKNKIFGILWSQLATKDKGLIMKPNKEGMECWVDASHASEWSNKSAADDPNTARSRMGYAIGVKIEKMKCSTHMKINYYPHGKQRITF